MDTRNSTLGIFEEVNQLLQEKEREHYKIWKTKFIKDNNMSSARAEGGDDGDCDKNNGVPDLIGQRVAKIQSMKIAMHNESETIASYLRSCCWRIPLRSTTFFCYLEKDCGKSTSAGSDTLWSLYLDVGPYNPIRKFLIAGRRCSTKSQAYQFSTDSSCRLDTSIFCVAHLQKDPNENAFELFESGPNNSQILNKLQDESQRGNYETVKIAKKLASTFIMRDKGRKGNCWRAGQEAKFHCTGLIPQTPYNLCLEPEQNDLNLLDREIFSTTDWRNDVQNLNNCEKLNGELKKICFNGEPDLTSQLILNRTNWNLYPEEVFALTKLASNKSKKSYLVRFKTPLSICHAFGFAISAIESGFD